MMLINYDIGIKRLQAIVNQKILLTEVYTTVWRRKRNITCVTTADITKMRKETKRKKRWRIRKRKWSRERPRGREDQGEDQEENQEKIHKKFNKTGKYSIIISLFISY